MSDPKLINGEAVTEGYRMQRSPLDKVWFSILMKAYAQTVTNAWIMTRPIEFEKHQSEQEREQIRQNVSINGSSDRYSDAEKAELQIPITNDNIRSADSLTRKLDNGHQNRLIKGTDMESETKFYRQAGLLNAKVSVEIGKEYYQNLDKLPPDEPDREEKAFYLTLSDTDSRANLLLKGYKSFQQFQDMTLSQSNRKQKHDLCPASDPEKLKQMSLDDYLNLSFRDKKDKQLFLDECKERGIECSLEDKAFGVLKQLYIQRSISKKEKTDREVAEEAYQNAYKSHRDMQVMYARDLAAGRLSQEDQKFYKVGKKIADALHAEYKPPKKIRDWVKNTGEPMLRQNRVQKLNENYEAFGNLLCEKKPLDIHQSPELRGSFNAPGFFSPSYEKYLAKHTGLKAVEGQTLEQQKQHLIRAVAAVAQMEAGKEYSSDRIHKWADLYAKRDYFKKLSPRDVASALIDRKHINELRRDMFKDRYSVPENDREDYLRQMRKLQQQLMPVKGTSDEYKAFSKAVSDVANLNPAAEDYASKLAVANNKLLVSIEKYSQGKKSVRRTDDGKERFNNCMDALAILNNHVPGLRLDVKEHEDRINEVRKAPVGHKNHLDLSQFGADRAEEAKTLREAKKNGKKEQDQPVVPSL